MSRLHFWRKVLPIIPGATVVSAKQAEAETKATVHCPSSSQLELRVVQVIFRHGARTPISNLYGYDGWFPTHAGSDFVCRGPITPLLFAEAKRLYNRNYNSSLKRGDPVLRGLAGPCRPGQLTAQGRKDLAQVGIYLRRRYIDELSFLKPEYVPEELFVRSTDVERTLESAVSLLEHLYPAQHVTPSISIHSLKEQDENMYPRSSCKALKALKSLSFQKNLKTRGSIRESLTAEVREAMKLDASAGQVSRFEGLHNTYQCYLANGVPLPHSVSSTLLEKIETEAVSEMQSKYGSISATRLAIGRFVNDLIHDLKLSASSPVRLRLYSGHDNTIGPLLMALETNPITGSVGRLKRFPAFASYIILELYEEKGTGRQWVRGRYSGQKEDLQLPGSNVNPDGITLVELQAFIKHMETMSLTSLQYEDECTKNPIKTENEQQ